MAENDSSLLIGWKQIAAYLRCAQSTARRQAREKGLPVFRVGGSVRARPADIDRWLAAQPRGDSAPGAEGASQALIVGSEELPSAVSNLGGRAEGHRYAVIPLGVEEAEFARMQELLQSAEERYQRLVEQVPVWIWETDAAGEFTYSNPRSRQILGYAPGDFTGFAPTEFAVAPEDAERFEESLRAVRENGSIMRAFRCRFVHRDGSQRWLETDAEPAFDAAGKFAGVRGVSRDVTEVVRAEAALQEAHERLKATLDALPDLLFEVDRAGRLYDFRAPDPDLLFADPETFLGRTVEEVLPPEAAAVTREALAEAAATGSHAGADYSLRVPAGIRWFELSIAARGDHHNPNCRFVVLVRDITERKRAATELRIHRDHLEELVEARTAELREVNVGLEREIADRVRAEGALGEQRTQLQTIITVTPDLLILLDRDLVYRAVNPAFCHFMGKREEELLGRTDFDVFPQELAEVYRQSDEEVLTSGELRFLEREVVDADGTRRWLQVAKAPIFDAAGEVSGLLVSARDITEHRQVEEALRESEGKFRNLAEESPNMIFINSRGKVVYANKRCEEMMAYTREEFYAPDFDFLTLIEPASRESVRKSFAAHSRGDDVEPYEYALVAKDGRKIEAILTT
ncbi:MAG: PAS domain S-box protein, partial [Candidatus Coatesbacteria bacterium]